MKNGEILTTLLRAYVKIEDPEHWCQHDLAKTQWGMRTYADSPSAKQWCAVGSLQVASGNMYVLATDLGKVLTAAAKLMGYIAPDTLNDARDHTTVLEMYQTAITFVMLCIAAHEPAVELLP